MVTATNGEENSEFCVAVDPATRTAGMLTQSVKGAGSDGSGSDTSLVGGNSRRLKAPNELISHATDQAVSAKFSYFPSSSLEPSYSVLPVTLVRVLLAVSHAYMC